MDIDEWLIETEKLGLSELNLVIHIGSIGKTTEKVFWELKRKFGAKSSTDLAKILYNKWNTKNDLYTEITAYKLQNGIIVETEEQAEKLYKEFKIRLDLSEIVAEDYVDIIVANLERIKKIINQ